MSADVVVALTVILLNVAGMDTSRELVAEPGSATVFAEVVSGAVVGTYLLTTSSRDVPFVDKEA